MKSVLWANFLFLLSLTSHAADDMTVRFQVDGAYDAASFSRSGGGKAYFTGTGYGFSGEMRAGKSGYGLGLRISYEGTGLDNTSNTAANTESLENTYINIVPRIYALDLYFGAGLVIQSTTYSGLVSGNSSKESYSGIGARFEFGYDWYFSQRWYLSPNVSYSISKVRSDNSTSSLSYGTFKPALGLGVRF